MEGKSNRITGVQFCASVFMMACLPVAGAAIVLPIPTPA